MRIEDAVVGQRVVISSLGVTEEGIVSHIDIDGSDVYVDVETSRGVDTECVDASEVEPAIRHKLQTVAASHKEQETLRIIEEIIAEFETLATARRWIDASEPF